MAFPVAEIVFASVESSRKGDYLFLYNDFKRVLVSVVACPRNQR